MTRPSATLLLNWIYYQPVGHAVEAFAAAADYCAANPDLQVHLLLNRRTSFELAGCCSWIHAVYPIDIEEVAARGADASYLSDVPRITGSTDATAGRSITHGYARAELEGLFRAIPGARNCYDVGLANQLALLGVSDLFISPHSGFAFLAPCVGTPWLAISGSRWPDPTYARVPFYAVLPSCEQHPRLAEMRPQCRAKIDAGIRVDCMDRDLDARIGEVAEGVRWLQDPAFDLSAGALPWIPIEPTLQLGSFMKRAREASWHVLCGNTLLL